MNGNFIHTEKKRYSNEEILYAGYQFSNFLPPRTIPAPRLLLADLFFQDPYYSTPPPPSSIRDQTLFAIIIQVLSKKVI